MKTVLSILCAVASLSVVLDAAETAVIDKSKVIVRGQPSIHSEILTRLDRGAEVIILEEIPVKNPKQYEPTNWVRIQMPTNVLVWAFDDFIDTTNNTVSVKKLNLRAGPGENYSVVGTLTKGENIQVKKVVDQWVQLAPPPSAYAFVATETLKRTTLAEPPVAVAPIVPVVQTLPATLTNPKASIAVPQVLPATVEREVIPDPAPELKPLESAQVKDEPTLSPAKELAAAPQVTKPVDPAPLAQPLTATNQLPPLAPEVAPVVSDAPAARRMVRREGLVKGTFSIQAPSHYELVSLENGKAINYLNGQKSGIELKEYKGKRVVVTGEEGLDPRWTRTPVIELETVEVAQ